MHPHVKRRIGLYGTALVVAATLFVWGASQIGAVEAASVTSLATVNDKITAVQASSLEQSTLSTTALLKKAVNLLDTPQRPVAMLMLKEVLRRNPESRDAALQLGYGYLQTGDLTKAQISLEHARDLDPIYPATYQLLAEVYTKQNQKDLAATALQRAQDFAKVPDLTK